MIIGHGDIATVLAGHDKPDWTLFASGVSNSRETARSEFIREENLLKAQPLDKRLIYFSSLAVMWTQTPYFEHKRTMERLVKYLFPKHTIVRFGNITWGTNPNTIINFFKGQRERGEPISIQDAERYIIDQEEFLHWVDRIPDWNCEMNITGKRMKVIDIVKEYVYGNA